MSNEATTITEVDNRIVNILAAQKDAPDGISSNNKAILQVDTISNLQITDRKKKTVAYVEQEGRGGFFNYVTEAEFSGSADLVNSFPALDGGYWVRKNKTTTTTFNQSLEFDNFFGKYLDLEIQTSNISFSLDSLGFNIFGGQIVAKVFASGGYTFDFTDDFDFIYGLTPGSSLPEGTHEIYFLYKPNGKVSVNVPSGVGVYEQSSVNISNLTLTSPNPGELKVDWI